MMGERKGKSPSLLFRYLAKYRSNSTQAMENW